MVQVAGRQGRQLPAQDFGRFVGQPAEHHVRHLRQLLGDRAQDMGRIVAMAGSPPGGDPVHQNPAVRQDDAGAFGAHSFQGRGRCLHLGVRAPKMAVARAVHGPRRRPRPRACQAGRSYAVRRGFAAELFEGLQSCLRESRRLDARPSNSQHHGDWVGLTLVGSIIPMLPWVIPASVLQP